MQYRKRFNKQKAPNPINDSIMTKIFASIFILWILSILFLVSCIAKEPKTYETGTSTPKAEDISQATSTIEKPRRDNAFFEKKVLLNGKAEADTHYFQTNALTKGI